MPNPFPPQDLFVATNGRDNWSGSLPKPNKERTDGPLASVAKAREIVRERKRTGALAAPLTVWIRGGRYELAEPLVFTPEDSAPVTYAAYPREKPVFSGGRRIEGWRAEKLRGQEVWAADVPEARDGRWIFRSLFVNGRRAQRSRWPKVGKAPDRRNFLRIADVPGGKLQGAQLFESYNAFVAEPGDIEDSPHVTDIEAVILHFWIEERMPIAAYDSKTRLVRSSHHSRFPLTDDWAGQWARYYLDNVFEKLGEPGEWYLDARSGKVYYVPRHGEKLEEIQAYAPRLEQLLKLEGRPAEEKHVEFLRFVGLTFEHTEWRQVVGGRASAGKLKPGIQYAATAQAASDLPGAVALLGARNCALEDCTIRHVGWYAVDLADGCIGNRVVGCELTDLGAGGVKLNGGSATEPPNLRTGGNRITDNHIHDGGSIFHSAVGVIAMHSFGNTISHNRIHDLFYSGISCGWVWGYRDSVSKDNRIEFNHIHDLGYGWLSDMGGIYTLGVQPGTAIRRNLIHDIEQARYGGWGIYLDEGSAHIRVEENICYRLGCEPFHEHYGRENMIRNNIWALGKNAVIALGRAEGHLSFVFERNILLTDGQPFFWGGYGTDVARRNWIGDLNLFWDLSGQQAPLAANSRKESGGPYDWAAWQKLGQDLHSLVADPKFKDPRNGDFRMAKDSPALRLGFVPFDLKGVGPRPKARRT